MTVTWLPPTPPFAKRVKVAERIIPSEDVLNGCIAGLTKQIKKARLPERKQRLKDIREEIIDLRNAL